MRILTTCKCKASYRLNRVPAQGDLLKVTDSLQQVCTKLNNQILDQTHLEGKWLYCVDSVVVKCDLFQVLQPLEGLKIYSPRNNLDFGDFLISGLVASFPVLVLKCHPICLHQSHGFLDEDTANLNNCVSLHHVAFVFCIGVGICKRSFPHFVINN